MLSKTITKKSVIQSMDKLFIITFNLVLVDDSGPGLNQDFTVEYRTGDSVSTKTAKVIADMQTAVDKYKTEQQIFNSAGLNTAVTTISNGVTL